MTASGHESASGERAIANDRSATPDGQGNEHAHDGSGSGQKTATALVESGHGVTGHDATESFHAESGSGQKTATAHGVSDHEKSVMRTMTTETSTRATLDPCPEERESREDKAREQEADDSLEFSRRGTCGENWGESTDSETREKGVCRERATPTPPPPEGEGKEGASPPTPDASPEALPPLSLDRGRAGGEGAPPSTTPGAPRDPSCPPKGREEEAEVPGRETPEEVSARGEDC